MWSRSARTATRSAIPPGNLDPTTAHYVFDALAALVRASGLAALIVTHNMDLALRMDRRITLNGGRVVEF